MKKVYEKPRILIEEFSLTQSVAVSCGVPENNQGQPHASTPANCAWEDWFGDMYWHTVNNVCTVETDDDANVGGMCYNEPNGGFHVFGS